MHKKFMVFCLLMILGLLALYPGPGDAGLPEVIIWQKIQRHLERGQLQAACALTEKLWPYKETPTYERAEASLKKRGISIGDPLGSYTLMRIVALQNKLEDSRAKTGRMPSPGPRKNYEDGWFKPIRVEIITRKGFAYMLRAAGRDGKWMTNDDYVIGVRNSQGQETEAALPSLDKGARKAGKSSMLSQGSTRKQTGPSDLPDLPGADLTPKTGAASTGSKYNGTGAAKKPVSNKNGEKSVTLDELLEQ